MVGAAAAMHLTMQEFKLRMMWVRHLADLRCLSKGEVNPQSPAIENACSDCDVRGVKLLGPCGKTFYPGQWCYLSPNHPLREDCCRLNQPVNADGKGGEACQEGGPCATFPLVRTVDLQRRWWYFIFSVRRVSVHEALEALH